MNLEQAISENALGSILIFFGLTLLIVNLLFTFLKPKKPNMIYGYRTRRSMKGQEEWDFAQKESSKLSLRMGLASMAFSSIGFVLDFSETTGVIIGISWILLVSIFLIYKVEKRLKEKFGD